MTMRDAVMLSLGIVWLWVGLEAGYRIGQHHPRATEFVTYAAAVELATERQQVGYEKGFEACQEQF